MSGTWLVFSRIADKAVFFCTVALNSGSKGESTSTSKHMVCGLTLLFSAGTSVQNTGVNLYFSNGF